MGMNVRQIPTLLFVASEYTHSLKLVRICCYITLLLPAEYLNFYFDLQILVLTAYTDL